MAKVFAGAVAQTSIPTAVQLGVQAVIYHGGYLPFRDPNSEENSNDIAPGPPPQHPAPHRYAWAWGLQGPGGQRRGWGMEFTVMREVISRGTHCAFIR